MNAKANNQEHVKADILRHTLALAGETGWPGVSTRKIADRLQTSTTAIYHYFGNKDAILTELQRDGFRQLREMLLTTLARETKPKRQLKAASRAMLQFARANPDLYALMFNLDGAMCRSDAANEATEGMEQVKTVLSQLTKDDIESVFVNWFALVQGFVSLARNDMQAAMIDWFDTVLDEAIKRFIKGL